MGFGILLFGYFLAFSFTLLKFYVFADIIGAVIMIIAFVKLKEYNRYFIRSIIFCGIFILACAATALSLIFRLYEVGSVIDTCVKYVRYISACLMMVTVFLGIIGLAGQAGAANLVTRAKRNMILTVLLYVIMLAYVPLSGYLTGNWASYVMVAVYLYGAIVLFLNLLLFYSCFGKLCDEGEKEDEVKKSRFRIVNKLNEKFDEIEKGKEAYRKESVKLAVEEADRRAAAKKSKKKKKKK